MKLGHRGANHPVKNLIHDKVEITSQNHGFEVIKESLPKNVEVTHKSLFDNVEYDRCIFCGGSRTEIARTDFTIMFSEFEYNTGSICKTCYSANAKQVKAI